MFENPRRGRQARNFGKNGLKILDLNSSSEQIFSENCRWVPLNLLESLKVLRYCRPLKNITMFGPQPMALVSSNFAKQIKKTLRKRKQYLFSLKKGKI